MASVKELTLNDALHEVKNVSWPMLLEALGIDESLESRIADQYGADSYTAMKEVLRHWINNHEDVSWKALAEALMSLPQFRRHGTYIYNKYVNPECFTAEKIAEELDFVEDWFQLAHPFLDDSDQVKKAVENVPLEQRPKRVMEAWLDYYDVPSWDEVANVVEDCFPVHQHVAERIRKKYLPEVAFRFPGEKKLSLLENLNSMTSFTETSDITDWYALGWFLGVSEEELSEIEANYQRNDSKRQAVLDRWLETDREEASWLALAKAISKMRLHGELSKKIMKRDKLTKESMQPQGPQTIIEPLQSTAPLHEEEEADGQSTIEDSPSPQDSPHGFIMSAEKAEELADGIGAIQKTIERLKTEDKDSILKVNAALENVKEEFRKLQIETSNKETSSVPESILKTMSIISEIEMTFTSDEDTSLDWSQYGFRLHIPRGSIQEGETGTLRVYALNSRSFRLPSNTQLASAVYYISMSHDLLKECTLEIQHCSRATHDDDGNPLLTFMHVPNTQPGLPYTFKSVQGGEFDSVSGESTYGIIKRRTFSLYSIGQMITQAVKFILGLKSKYILLWCLTATSQKNWSLKLALIKDLNAYKEQETQTWKYVVKGDNKMVTPTGNTVKIGVSPEEASSPVTVWNGNALKIVSEWEIVSMTYENESLQLWPDEIEDKSLSSQVRIDIHWSVLDRQSPPTHDTFRVHIMGIQRPFSIPITVPQPYRSTISSEAGSMMITDDSKTIRDPPTEEVFLERIESKATLSTDELATYLLNEQSRITFRNYLKSTMGVADSHRVQFIRLFDAWKTANNNFNWDHLITCLKQLKEMRLAKNLENSYDYDVFSE